MNEWNAITVNDWFSNHWRPSGPMLNFVYMYFQQCVLDKDATVSEIFDAVRKYFKRICPQIKDNLISNYQPANPNHKVYGKPSCYIECWPENVTCVFEKQTADWKPVNLSNGLIVFNQPVNFIFKGLEPIEKKVEDGIFIDPPTI